MTIPFQNIPDTRPGYAFQNPGVGGVINQGLLQVLQAIIAGTEARQRDQQLEQSRVYQTGQLQVEQDKLDAARRAAEAKLAADREIGLGMGMMGQSLPVGMTGTTGPLTMESVLQLVSPENRPAFTAEAAPLAKRQEDRQKLAREEAEKARIAAADAANVRAFIAALSPEEQRSIGPMIQTFSRAGASLKDALTMANERWAHALTPAQDAAMVRRYPALAALPTKDRVQRYGELVVAELRRDITPARLLRVPASERAGHRANQMTMDQIKATLAKLGYDPDDPDFDAYAAADPNTKKLLERRRSAVGPWNIGGLAYKARAAAGDSEATGILDAIQELRAPRLHKLYGGALTRHEIQQAGFLPSAQAAAALNVQVDRLRRMYQWASRENRLIESAFDPRDYEQLNPYDPVSEARQIGGTYRPQGRP